MPDPIHPVIVVPLYKELAALDNAEKASFNRLLSILGRYPVVFFCSPRLGLEAYTQYAANAGVVTRHEFFEDQDFVNIDSYSHLMMSLEFYERFAAYSHMLIYQLDAYVFEDELEKWCRSGYDYIGAPWIEDKSGKHITGNITGVGNGGFCLRTIPEAIRVLSSKKPFKRFSQLLNEYQGLNGIALLLRYPRTLIRAFTGWKNTGYYYARNFFGSEDAFWCGLVPLSRYPFRVASVTDAIAFSFEVAPEQLFHMNKERLPFGCHAWFKHQPDFWRKFIQW